jgi:outer membrane protein assembly factor BamB
MRYNGRISLSHRHGERMQHVAVLCPRCQSRYQVEPGLVGKRMRCPNALCRHIFEVHEAAPAADATSEAMAEMKSPAGAGTVGEFVQILPAELARPPEPIKPAPPAEPTPLAEPAPPVEAIVAPPQRIAPAADAPTPDDGLLDDFPTDDDSAEGPVAPDGPAQVNAGTWEAPPVRAAVVATDDDDFSLAPTPKAPPPPEPAPPAVPRPRRWPLVTIAAMLTALIALAGLVWWEIESERAGSERERVARAEALYRDKAFAEAAGQWQQLYRDYPDSAAAKNYRFLAELSDVRAAAYARADDAETNDPALQRVLEFVGVYQNDPLLKDRHADVWETLHRLADRLAERADEEHGDDALRRARRAWAEAKKFDAPAGTNVAAADRRLTTEFDRAEKDLADFTRRQSVVAALKEHLERATAADVQAARALVRKSGLETDAEIAGLLAELPKAHLRRIEFVPAGPGETVERPPDDALPSLAVTPALVAGTAPVEDRRVVLALVRGVLYALDPVDGTRRWCRRVGVDTRRLPLRLPADDLSPERVLVVAADGKSVSALVAETGVEVWRQALPDVCLGRPVVIGRSVLVPTLAGRVEEIDTAGGRRLGGYDLGQRLSVGGVQQPGTPLVHFAADEFCVYSLDAAARRCVSVLYTGHPAGSLRDVPIVLSEATTGIPVPGPTDPAAGWLMLCQADGDGVAVRPFALPVRSADQPPAEVTARAAGLSWYAPWHDAEKIALATDTGFLSLWGIRQKRNRDPLLFPLFKDEYLVDAGRRPGRAQVVHADAENYWVLTRGRLHRLQSTFKSDTGPGLLPRWPDPPALGSPLHAGQRRTDASGRTTLFLTTQALDRPTAVCTAIDAETGRVFWQRQLGTVPLTDLAAVGNHVVVRDPSGLVRLDAAALGEKPAVWSDAGELIGNAAGGGDDRFVLEVAGAGGFVELSWPAADGIGKVTVRRLTPDGTDAGARTFALPAAPTGTPALGDGFAVLALANGVAARLDLETGGVVSGPDWRAAGADEQAPGHVVPLGGGEFLITDGSVGLARLHWPEPKVWDRRAATKLAGRIVAPPAVLRDKRVAVADAADGLTLVGGDRLTVARRWKLPGRVTAGPFVRGGGVGCVVEHRRLVWLDPAKDDPAWEYAFDAPLVGEPLLTDGLLVVADAAGQVRALDPATGTPRGDGVTFRASVAPAAAPVPFGPARLLVSLTDGTLVVVSLDRLVSPR